MGTWPNRGGLRRPLRGAGIMKVQAPKQVKPLRFDSNQQASSKVGAVHIVLEQSIEFAGGTGDESLVHACILSCAYPTPERSLANDW